MKINPENIHRIVVNIAVCGNRTRAGEIASESVADTHAPDTPAVGADQTEGRIVDQGVAREGILL